jgi:hypothetical protein
MTGLLRRVLQLALWPAPRPRQGATIVLAPGVSDPAPALFAFETPTAHIISADSAAALEHLQALGDRYDLGFSQ